MINQNNCSIINVIIRTVYSVCKFGIYVDDFIGGCMAGCMGVGVIKSVCLGYWETPIFAIL